MQYLEKVGNYLDAYSDVMSNGGQLFTGNGKDSANVILRGKTCITYWSKDSKRHQEVIDVCNMFDLDPVAMTGGRLCRWLLKEFLGLQNNTGYWGKRWRQIAMDGSHWHYTHCVERQYFYGIEIDIKSAYMSSFLSGKSMLFSTSNKWSDDNGALEQLKQLTLILPKWLRLQLIGTMSAWRISFLAKDKKNPQSDVLTRKYRHGIQWGAAFNASHRAILRNYKIMQKIHRIGGEYIKRCHTDSFTLDLMCPTEIENQIFSYIKEKNLQTDVKNIGYALFFDLNTGFIGKNLVGSPICVIDHMREEKVKMKASGGVSETVDRFGHLLHNSNYYNPDGSERRKIPNLEPLQLELDI